MSEKGGLCFFLEGGGAIAWRILIDYSRLHNTHLGGWQIFEKFQFVEFRVKKGGGWNHDLPTKNYKIYQINKQKKSKNKDVAWHVF